MYTYIYIYIHMYMYIVILPFEPLSEPKNLLTITAQPLKKHDVRFRGDTSAQVTSRWVGRDILVSVQP